MYTSATPHFSFIRSKTVEGDLNQERGEAIRMLFGPALLDNDAFYFYSTLFTFNSFRVRTSSCSLKQPSTHLRRNLEAKVIMVLDKRVFRGNLAAIILIKK